VSVSFFVSFFRKLFFSTSTSTHEEEEKIDAPFNQGVCPEESVRDLDLRGRGRGRGRVHAAGRCHGGCCCGGSGCAPERGDRVALTVSTSAAAAVAADQSASASSHAGRRHPPEVPRRGGSPLRNAAVPSVEAAAVAPPGEGHAEHRGGVGRLRDFFVLFFGRGRNLGLSKRGRAGKKAAPPKGGRRSNSPSRQRKEGGEGGEGGSGGRLQSRIKTRYLEKCESPPTRVFSSTDGRKKARWWRFE